MGADLLFGSEQKAILEYPDSRKEMDKRALLEYFIQNLFTDRTLLENVLFRRQPLDAFILIPKTRN